MTTETISPLVQPLNHFDEVWILQGNGFNNEQDRRNALAQARENLANMPLTDDLWLLRHLGGVAVELKNPKPYGQRILLELTAYAIIGYIRIHFRETPLHHHIRSMNCEKLQKIYEKRKVE